MLNSDMNKDLRKVLDDFFRINHFSDEQKADEAVELINKAVRNCIPKMLYRHRTCSKYSIRGFRNDSVIAVSPSLFNDPYDCLLKYNLPENKGGMSKDQYDQIAELYKNTGHLPEEFERYMPLQWIEDFKKIIEQYIAGEWSYNDNSESDFDSDSFIEKNALVPCSDILHKFSRVACFSEKKDSVLMWSHYTDQHKGFVLGYDLSTEFNKDALDYLYPVIYSNKRYDASEAMRYLVGEMIKMQNNVNGDQLFYLAGALYKSKDWAYEKEWRLISYGNKEELVEIKLRPSCIYYGSRIDPDDLEELHEIAVSKGIREYNATVDRTSSHYRMKLERLK